MPLFESRAGSFIILNTATTSNVLKAHDTLADALTIVVYGPAAINNLSALTFEVTNDPDAAAPVFLTLKDAGGTNVAVPLAAEARVYQFQLGGNMGVRIKSGTAANADTTFLVSKQVWGS